MHLVVLAADLGVGANEVPKTRLLAAKGESYDRQP